MARTRTEDCPKRVRAMLDGNVVVDSTHASYVWEGPNYPVYGFPADDVRLDVLPEAAWEETAGGLIRVDWRAVDHWLEEDEEVYVHPRSPYTRIDILQSSRFVRVEVNGVTIAETSQPRLLFETGLQTRYYLPLPSVRLDLLRPSARLTQCPYKGTASYSSVEAGGQLVEDVAWTYKTPLPESQKIAGLIAFYNERVDIVVDGVAQ